MLIRQSPRWKSSAITPRSLYLDRRRLLIGGAGALLAGASLAEAQKMEGVRPSRWTAGPEKLTPREAAVSYNNFYEFGTAKDDPARNAGKLQTRPWQVKVEGHCAKPRTFDIDSLLKLAPMEERVYRLRCVEAWSMVIPWIGYPVAALLKAVEPTARAKYVAFESYYNPGTMWNQQFAGIDFPYREGLRMDEAMHPLAILCFGMYGELLPKQNGAPIRLIVPWKYGFKSIKSIARIRLVEKQPDTTWNLSNAREYGFYSNVNPEVDHPRWSQATERRIGELTKRRTLKFNGYDEVAALYAGLDLNKHY